VDKCRFTGRTEASWVSGISKTQAHDHSSHQIPGVSRGNVVCSFGKRYTRQSPVGSLQLPRFYAQGLRAQSWLEDWSVWEHRDG